jgi:putative transposase
MGYYWVDRFRETGNVAPRSRRPHSSPSATPAAMVARLCAARQAHPTWGAGKLRNWLTRQDPATHWPARDTIHEVCRRHGLVRQRVRRRAALHPAVQLTAARQPNALWTADYKGEFRLAPGAWCYPFTLRDACSRYVLRCTALASHTGAVTQPEFVHAFRAFGLPERIRSDNGAPFAAPGLARLSRLAVWWIRLGIVPERITPRHPEQNGSHEQFHAVLQRETTHPPAGSLRAQQRRFTAFIAEYNEQRPHDALGGLPPTTRYQPSCRVYPETLPTLEYPAAWEVRRVGASGSISWRGQCVFLTEVLCGECVALEPVDDAVWLIRFATLPLARFDERHRRLLPVLPASAASARPLGV